MIAANIEDMPTALDLWTGLSELAWKNKDLTQVCVCVCVCVCVRACMRACVRACVRVYVYICECIEVPRRLHTVHR